MPLRPIGEMIGDPVIDAEHHPACGEIVALSSVILSRETKSPNPLTHTPRRFSRTGRSAGCSLARPRDVGDRLAGLALGHLTTGALLTGVRTATSMTMATERMVAEPTKRPVTYGTYCAAAVLVDNR